MNVFLLLTSMTIGAVYHPEDFHYYDESLQGRGTPIVNKVYIDVASAEGKRKFLEFADDNIKTLEQFKDIKTDTLNGLLLVFKNDKDALEALNKCLEKEFPASPVILYDGIECTHANSIVVNVHPSVIKEDFLKRLNTIAEGNFNIQELKPKVYLITVEKLKNPSNVFILANLLAKDSAWTRYAMVSWRPLDGYVKASAVVETPAVSHLGEIRNLKITLNVFDPDIKIRTDLLPQMGQGLTPFPFPGEVWFDPFPLEIQEIRTEKRKTVIINYPFRQLQYGAFAFQPVLISYEKDGELRTTKTDVCQYNAKSVIIGTDIDDIQPRANDGLDLMILRPVGFPKKDNPMKMVYQDIKVIGSAIFFGIGGILLLGSALVLKRKVAGWFAPDEKSGLWSQMLACRGQGKAYYVAISQYLNNILNQVFGTSLYSIKRSECTETFKNLVNELDKIYQPSAVFNHESLRDFLVRFCRERRYK